MSSPRVLLVDEDDDNREMIAVALESAGYDVDRAASAGEAIARLRERRYRLVIGHYGLPDKTAGAMLKEAKAEGLMEETAALIITGQPELAAADGLDVIAKPLDIARLLRQVGVVCGPAPARAPARVAAGEAVTPVELALYVSLPWPSSLKAHRNLQKVLAGFEPSQVRLIVHDLAKDPARAEADGIVFLPTLVKQSPEPRAWVMGDLSDRRVLSNLLLMCGLEPRKSKR
jgi:circadian clock protein KaiB